MAHDRRTFLRTIGAGSIGLTAAAAFSNSAAAATVITMEGGGADIWNEADEFHYYYEEVSGDFDVVVQNLFIEDTTGWAKCGIMARESLEPDAKNLMLRRTPGDDASPQWRAEASAGSDHTNSSEWMRADLLRMKRDDDTLKVYGSQGRPADDGDWTLLGAFGPDTDLPDLELSDELYLGLAVTSHVEGELCTATFQGLSGLSPTTNHDIGDVEVAGSVSVRDGVPFTSTLEAAEVTATSATLRGSLDDLGGAESAEVFFEYRVGGGSWTVTGSEVLTATGTFEREITGLSREVQDYEFRAIVETSDGDDAAGSSRSFTTPSVITIESIDDVTATSATVVGELSDLGGAKSADVRIEYRVVPTESWITTDERTLTGPSLFEIDLPELTSRRYYRARAIVETDNGDTITSLRHLFGTPSRSNGRHAQGGPESASQFDPTDGFADPAPWLNDDTPVIKITESTKEMFERAIQVDGPRLVVFETSGTIDLRGEQQLLSIDHDKMYLAGQTAPSPGITFVRGGISVDASDCVIQHLRFRAGDAGKEADWEPDSLTMWHETENNVIDHCSTTWGIDECLSGGSHVTELTVTNCLIGEALHDSTHSGGSHGYGSIAAGGNDSADVVWMGNVWAHNSARNPRYGGEVALVNNVMYHFELGTVLDNEESVSSIVGNAYLRGSSKNPNIENGSVYLHDNYTVPDKQMADIDEVLDEPPIWPDGVEALPAEEVIEHNLENAGARPADRTDHDERLLKQVRDRTGDFIDSQKEVGGYPDLPENEHGLNVPASGTRAWLRSWARRVERPNN